MSRLPGALAVVGLLALAGPASAHPAGLPPLAEISFAGTSIRTSLSLAMDDAILLFATSGAEAKDPTSVDADALATQPEAATYVTSRYTLAVPEGICTGEVVGGRRLPGVGFRFIVDHSCPAPVGRELTARTSLLRDLSPAYRLALSVKIGSDRVRYTIAEAQDEVVMDLSARPRPDKTVQEGPDRSASGRLFLFEYLESGKGPGAAAIALGVAALLGALHALTPGHGKTLVAAYVAGTEAKVRHALGVGVVLTVTHTGVVFLLGIAALSAGSSISGQRVERVLHAVSAALVLGLGLFMLFRRVRALRDPHGDHHHHHEMPAVATGEDHAPAVREVRSGRGMFAVAAAGGILPCPEAFGLLFASMTFGRVLAGLLVLVAFSVGLGAVLFAVTLSLIVSKRAVTPTLERSRVVRYLPVVSALIVTGFGVALAIGAARAF